MTTQTDTSAWTATRKEVGARPRPHTSIRIVVALALSALVFAGWLTGRALKSRGAPQLDYETAAISHGPIAAKVSATGALSALVMVSVGSQVSGRIATLGADFGSQVHAGDVVATIDPSLFRAAVQQARANHAAARANIERAQAQVANLTRAYERARALADQRLLAPADFDLAEANLRVARADVKAAVASEQQSAAAEAQAELNLHYTTIISPIDGVVISRNVDVGQTVAAALQAPTLFTIARDLKHMQVDTNVPEADVGKIREGMPVSFSVDAYPGQLFTGRVRQVRDNAQTLQNVVTYDAVVDVENDEHLLKPGMTASVSFVYAERKDAQLVSNAALRLRPEPSTIAAWHASAPAAVSGEHVLWMLRRAGVEPVRVRVGISDGSVSELLAGDLKPGERAITEVNDPGKRSR